MFIAVLCFYYLILQFPKYISLYFPWYIYIFANLIITNANSKCKENALQQKWNMIGELQWRSWWKSNDGSSGMNFHITSEASKETHPPFLSWDKNDPRKDQRLKKSYSELTFFMRPKLDGGLGESVGHSWEIGLQLPSWNGRNYSHTFMIADWRVRARQPHINTTVQVWFQGHTLTHSHKDMATTHTLRVSVSSSSPYLGQHRMSPLRSVITDQKLGWTFLSFSVSCTLEWEALVPHTLCNRVKDGQVCASGGDSSVEWLTSQHTLSDRLFLIIMLSWPIFFYVATQAL